MTRYQLLLLPVLAGVILVLGGALKQKAPIAKPLLMADASIPADAPTLELLDKAAAALAPDQLRWLECQVWQQGMCEDFTYQGCGRLVMAPGDRSRFDLNVKVGKTVAEMRLVCDGRVLAKSVRVGGDKTPATRLDVPSVKDRQKSAAELSQARVRWLQENGAAGLGPLLSSFRQPGKGARSVQIAWKGRDVHVIAVALPEDGVPAGVGPDFVRPRFQLRQGVLYLDAETLWPHRVEWWGAEKPGQPLKLVMQTEYRNPVVNQPLPAERCAAEFALAVN